jgi:hypothetical protein
MEIRIERDANALLGARSLQNLWILGTTEADFGHVNHVPPALAQQSDRGSRQALIEQKAFHTGLSGCTLPSRFRAANSSA